MLHTSYIEISKSKLKCNIDFIKSFVKDGTKISSVVKGDAYGHSIEAFVPLAYEFGIHHFSVFSSDEALKVQQSLSAIDGEATIMIMGMIENKDLNWAISNDIEFFVFENDRLEAAIKAAEKANRKAKIHIEIETGLNRTGFTKKELIHALPLLKSGHIEIVGLCTHYGGAESIANFYRIKEQKKKYHNMSKWLSEKGINPAIKHTACSAAMIRYPDTQMDMVRIGILQYGFWPSMETFIHYISKAKREDSPIKRIISWKSQIMSIKHVKAGEFISYGTSYLTQSDTKIATVPVGYAHGYARSLSNQGLLIINGKRVAVIGLVNMNMLIADVTEIEDVRKGDEVIIIGSQNNLEISVASFGEMSNQLNYELLTRLPDDIPRNIIE